MPFCTHCGKPIGERNAFCANCGTRQAGPSSQAPPKDFLADMHPRTAATLCYVPWLGWIASVIVLASARFREDRDTRFHAFQGLYLFVAWLMADRVLRPIIRQSHFMPTSIVDLLQLAVFAAWIFMMVKVSRNESFRLPFVGELADKSVAEQR